MTFADMFEVLSHGIIAVQHGSTTIKYFGGKISITLKCISLVIASPVKC